MTSTVHSIGDLWESRTAETHVPDTLELTNTREILPSIYRVGAVATASVAMAELAFDRLGQTLGAVS